MVMVRDTDKEGHPPLPIMDEYITFWSELCPGSQRSANLEAASALLARCHGDRAIKEWTMRTCILPDTNRRVARQQLGHG